MFYILFLIPPSIFPTEINFLSPRLNENKTFSNLFYSMFCVCVIPQGHVLPYQVQYICRDIHIGRKVKNKLQFQFI